MSKQEEADMIFAKGLLDDLETNDISFDNWEDKKDIYLRGKVSWATWQKYWKEKKAEENIKPKYNACDVMQLIAARREEEASEVVVEIIMKDNYIDSIKQDKTKEIWFYENGIRKPNGESHIRELCRKILEDAYTPQRANKVLAKIEADTYIEADEFFKKEMENIDEIPVLNGILNVRTRELSDYTPDKIFFNKINATYDPDAGCPFTKKFMKDVLRNPEDIDVSFEISGSCLYKKYSIQSAIMLEGAGENGKGVWVHHLRKFLGEQNCSSVPLNQLTPDSFSVAGLFGKLANLAGDISNTDLKDTGRFKELTSGTDLVAAKRKFLTDLFFENYGKLIFSCNELPKVYDFSHGFWRRWLIIEFPYKFLKQKEFDLVEDKTNIKLAKPDIIDEISTPEEMSGFLNESLDGLDRIFKTKQFSNTKSTAEVKNFWIRKSDSFTSFCMDCLEEDLDNWVSKKNIRKQFSRYCKKHKVKGAGDKNIKAVLEDLFGIIESRRQVNDNYDREWVWEGIRFKQEVKR